MKLLMVTSVEEFHNDILQLFKKAGIQNFSESEEFLESLEHIYQIFWETKSIPSIIKIY